MEEDKRKASLLSLLAEVAAEEGFRKPNVQLGGGSKLVNGFIGVVQRVLIEETEPVSKKPSLSLIVKCMPASKARREIYKSINFFLNEAVLYNEIIPAFQDFQTEKGITKDLTPLHPRCLRAGDMLIVEDQNALGFIMKDGREPLDYAHCLLVIRELGRLHAVSFALRDQKPALFKRLTAALKEPVFVSGGLPTIRKLIEPAAARALERLDENLAFLPEEKRKYIDALKEYSVDFYNKVAKTLSAEDAEPYAVINHGDLWINNFLFKYKEDGTEIDAFCLLDYQICRLASPACDISYFIYCCTDKATRCAHYHQLLQEYHSSLAEYLARLGSDVDKIFPMEALQDQMKRFGKYGMGVAMAFIPNFTCEASELPDIDEACEAGVEKFVESLNFPSSNDEPCWERICDVIVDAVDYGYIL